MEQEHLDQVEQYILNFVKKKGCSYPAELGRDLMIPHDPMVAILHKLIKQKRLKKMKLGTINVPTKLWKRIGEFWNIGTYGYESFVRMLWVEIPEKEEF